MFDFANRLAKSYRQFRSYRNAEAELGQLGDRELADLGIIRSDITRVVRSGNR